jgi:hypothetical protein
VRYWHRCASRCLAYLQERKELLRLGVKLFGAIVHVLHVLRLVGLVVQVVVKHDGHLAVHKDTQARLFCFEVHTVTVHGGVVDATDRLVPAALGRAGR